MMARRTRKEPKKVIVLVLESNGRLVDIFKTTDEEMTQLLKPNSEGISIASAFWYATLAPAWQQRLTRIGFLV